MFALFSNHWCYPFRTCWTLATCACPAMMTVTRRPMIGTTTHSCAWLPSGRDNRPRRAPSSSLAPQSSSRAAVTSSASPGARRSVAVTAMQRNQFVVYLRTPVGDGGGFFIFSIVSVHLILFSLNFIVLFSIIVLFSSYNILCLLLYFSSQGAVDGL